VDSIHVQVEQVDSRSRGRFDTPLIRNQIQQSMHRSNGESSLSYNYSFVLTDDHCLGLPGLQVAQVRVVFQIPSRFCEQVFLSPNSAALSTTHLAYVELFSVLPAAPDPNHLMYRVSRLIHEGHRRAIVIPVDWIVCSVHLFPQFGPVIPQGWDAFSVLENCQSFYVNPFSDRDVYLTIS
jgi:hypothetical protein